jgi:endonuclease/exonuclease/phosphatase (EEP) superfamily protein YafD
MGILISLIIHGIRLLPYIAGEKTVDDADSKEFFEENKLGILLANVFINNKEAPKLLKLIDEANPDLILVMEVNDWWISELQELQNNYPYFMEYPLDMGLHYIQNLN